MTTYYNASGEVREIDDDLYAGWVAAGNPKAQGWTPVPPPTPEQIAQALALERESIWGQIKGHRDAVKAQGVQVGANWFHSDDSSRIQQLGLVMMGAGLPQGVQWKTMAGTFVTMTPTLAGQIFQATAARDMAVFAAAEAHRAGVMTAPDPSAYNWQTGWPASYSG
jgi:hypothetical protein